MRGIAICTVAALLSGCLASSNSPDVGPLLAADMDGTAVFFNSRHQLADATSAFRIFHLSSEENITLFYAAEFPWNLDDNNPFLLAFVPKEGEVVRLVELMADQSSVGRGDAAAYASANGVVLESPRVLPEAEGTVRTGEIVTLPATEGTLVVAWANLPAPPQGQVWFANGTVVRDDEEGVPAAYEMKDFNSEMALGLPGLGSSEGELIVSREGQALTFLTVWQGSFGTGALRAYDDVDEHEIDFAGQPNGTCFCVDVARVTWVSEGEAHVNLTYAGPRLQTRVFVLTLPLDRPFFEAPMWRASEEQWDGS